MKQPLCNICKKNKLCKISPVKKKCDNFLIKPEKDFKVIVDSREQNPWYYDKMNNENFPGLKFVNDTLKTGDYSLTGFSDPEKHKHTICVERKSLADLYGTVGNGRERFEKELIRMTEFTQRAIIIEADLSTIIRNPPDYSRMLPKSVFRSLIVFSMRYGVQVWPCTNRSMAEKTAFIMLKKFYEDYVGTFTKTGIFKPVRFVVDE